MFAPRMIASSNIVLGSGMDDPSPEAANGEEGAKVWQSLE